MQKVVKGKSRLKDYSIVIQKCDLKLLYNTNLISILIFSISDKHRSTWFLLINYLNLAILEIKNTS